MFEYKNCLNLKGAKREKYFSKIIHQGHTPLLVSSKLLRDYGCGQLDIASIRENQQGEKEIHLYEVKSSLKVSYRQWQRLRSSADFLSSLLKMNTRLDIL